MQINTLEGPHSEAPVASQPQAVAPGASPSYTVLAMQPGQPAREIALNRGVAMVQALSYIPLNELRGWHCAVVVEQSDFVWWQICCQSLADVGIVMQPFTSRSHAMTWLAFMSAAEMEVPSAS